MKKKQTNKQNKASSILKFFFFCHSSKQLSLRSEYIKTCSANINTVCTAIRTTTATQKPGNIYFRVSRSQIHGTFLSKLSIEYRKLQSNLSIRLATYQLDKQLINQTSNLSITLATYQNLHQLFSQSQKRKKTKKLYGYYRHSINNTQ